MSPETSIAATGVMRKFFSLRAISASLFILMMTSGANAGERAEVIKDNSIILYPGETHLNHGKQSLIRIKGNQHLVAMEFDIEKIKGRLIKSATLVCRKAEKDISQVTVSTIQCEWNEEKSCALTSGMQNENGWGKPGFLFPAMTGGNSFSLVSHAKSVVENGAYHWEIDPDLIHAMLIDAAHGLTIHEVSSDYSRNPTIHARESKADAPYLLLTFGDTDQPPKPPSSLAIVNADGDPENTFLRLRAPESGFAYEVSVNSTPLPRWNIPFVKPAQDQLIPIRDLDLKPRQQINVSVRTISRTGRKSVSATVSATLPATTSLPRPVITTFQKQEQAVAGIDIIPVMDKYDENGKPVGVLPADYRSCNSVFDGKEIKLRAARGEVVGFQALIRGTGTVQLKCELPGIRTEMYKALYVDTPGGRVPDPLVPFDELSLSPGKDTSVCVDIFVPFDFRQREVKGSLALSDGRKIPILIAVRKFALPRKANFLCEMNSYGLPNTVDEFYRLQEIAYDHRVHCNILHYSHRTAAAGARKCNMDMVMGNGKRMDEKRYNDISPGGKTTYWDDFISVFDGYLSGKHFKDGHRGPIPAPGFYLTFHESWPLSMRPFFNGNPDAYEAFKEKPDYSGTYVNLLKDFVSVAKRQGWTEAGFQVYLNNKGELNDPAKSPWILDEPTAYWDYRALAYYGDLTKNGKGSNCPVNIQYRIDISRPEFDRGELLNKSDLWVVNMESFRDYLRLIQDRSRLTGEKIWVYGTSNNPEQPNRIIQSWALEAWRGGATGLVPWQTINHDGSALTKGDALGLFIFEQSPGKQPVIHHSMRLKAYRRAEQDIEYLILLRGKYKVSQSQMADFIRHYVNVYGGITKDSEADAGKMRYSDLTPHGYYSLLEATAALLEK